LDPFMGGGTTIVESCAMGRRAIGIDINKVAVFVSRVKTTILSPKDIDAIHQWSLQIERDLSLRNRPIRPLEWIKHGYQKNISCKATWPVRKTIELALSRLDLLHAEKQRRFARCGILRTAQWALDCRRGIPSASEFRARLIQHLLDMLSGIQQFSSVVRNTWKNHSFTPRHRVLCLHRSASGMDLDPRVQKLPRPRLILTSPPYPGIHVLYHRWQVRGRRETPAPFWIVHALDGSGASYYTFGDRQEPGLRTYFSEALSVYKSIGRVCGKDTLLVQLLAFSDYRRQLPRFLSIMEEAGFSELILPAFSKGCAKRPSRTVPNRRFYASQRGSTSSSKEFLLIHRWTSPSYVASPVKSASDADSSSRAPR
jgi:hypothetical protein